jgi:hypothetical protein
MLQVEEPQAGAIRSPNAIEGPMALRRRANLVMCSQQCPSLRPLSGGKADGEWERHAGESLIYFALEFALATRGK